MKQTFELNNGVHIPSIGFGTWQTPNGDVAVQSVRCAIEAGYRHIDTAAIYGNEVSVGQGIADSGIARSELFVTSKVWNTERGYDSTLAAFDRTLADLKLDYLDLYLIHWPATAHRFDNWQDLNAQTWRALEKLYADGRIRAIGVSNFMPHHLEPLLQTAQVCPAINQIEYHPGFMQADCVDFCRRHGIVVQAWSPLGSSRLLTHEVLVEMAKRYDRSVAQLCIRWVLQNDVLPLPKSVTPSRIRENLAVADFEISDADMRTLNALAPCGQSGLDPDAVDF